MNAGDDGNRDLVGRVDNGQDEGETKDMHRQHFNGVKTAALFGGLWALLLAIGWVLGRGTTRLVPLFAAIALISTAYGYWNSDKIAIRAMHAVPVSELEQPAMYRIVRELSTAARQPMPRLYVSPTAAPNAFATGRSPKHAAVCCTQGILTLLDERELRGVLGHELMHVYNRDILTSSVAAAVAGIVTSIAQFAMFFGGGGGDRRNANPLGGILRAAFARSPGSNVPFLPARRVSGFEHAGEVVQDGGAGGRGRRTGFEHQMEGDPAEHADHDHRHRLGVDVGADAVVLGRLTDQLGEGGAEVAVPGDPVGAALGGPGDRLAPHHQVHPAERVGSFDEVEVRACHSAQRGQPALPADGGDGGVGEEPHRL